MSFQITDDFRESFFQECEDLLEAMSDGFRQLSEADYDPETLNAVFRAAHSIKGGAGAFGLDRVVSFAHHLETALDRLRSGRLDAGPGVIELLQRCGDHLSDLVAAGRSGAVPDDAPGLSLRAELDALLGDTGQPPEAEPEFEPLALDLGSFYNSPAVYLIRFQALPELFLSGNDPALLFRDLARHGTLSVQADCTQVPVLAELDWQMPCLTWSLTLNTTEARDVIEECFEFVDGLCHFEIVQEPEAPGLIDLPPLPEPEPQAPEPALHSAPPPPRERTPGPATERPAGGSIRVDLDRVDRLINLVGELVIKEAMLSQAIASRDGAPESTVNAALENLKQLASEIQERVMAIRAQPVKPMFQRMARVVREAGQATGKPIRLVTQGEQTEVDKTVIERLIDPLTHMIRNAVDHGLEDPDRRRAAGKPAEGVVVLSAAHRSGRVLIDVSDDGAGIDRDKVRQLAVKRGLVPADAELGPAEIDNLLFMPGFSSREEVSALSGRGVGLDVARSEVQALGGRVSIASTPGRGTTFSISLPLTLAVLEGMVIDVAGQTMVVPITAIRETLQPRSTDIHAMGETGRVLANRDRLVPIADLGAVLGLRAPPEALDDHILLLIESDGRQHCALIVDGIQDQRQVVIKSLESNYGPVRGIAAATILGDGRIALIIDPETITRDVTLGPAASLSSAAMG